MTKVKILYTDSEVKREIKKRNKQAKKEAILQLEKETIQKEKMFFLLTDEQKREQIRLKQGKIKEYKAKHSFLDTQAKLLSYREWLTLRDILFYDKVQIQSDINKGKITNELYKRMELLSTQCIY